MHLVDPTEPYLLCIDRSMTRCVKTFHCWLLLLYSMALHRLDAFPAFSSVRLTRIALAPGYCVSPRISSTRILALKDENIQREAESTPVATGPLAEISGVFTDITSYSPTETNNNSNASSSFKYIMLGLLWLTACLSAIDRVAMSVAIIPMADEFGFTDTTKGSISSLLSFGYAIIILPAGILAGQWSPRLIMSSGIAIWSVATVATPFMVSADTNIGLLLAARMLVGAGESILLPTSTRLLNEWTAFDEKSRALAFVFSGFQAGTIVALLLSPIILDFFGDWRQLFYLYCSGSLLLLIPWLLIAKDSPTAKEDAHTSSINENQFVIIKEAPWREMLQSKGAWAMFLAHSAKNWGTYLALAWTPTFYLEQYGIGVRDSAWMSVLPCLSGVVGGLIAGTTADAVVKRIVDPSDDKARTKIRKTFQSIGLLVPALSLGLLAWHIPEQAWVAQLYISINIGFLSFNSAGYDAANQEKCGPKWAGLLYSVTSLPAVLMGTGATYLTGRILDTSGQDWSLVYGLNALIYVLGSVAFILLYDSKKEFE